MTLSKTNEIAKEMAWALEKYAMESTHLNAYEYEKGFREITDNYNLKLFQASLGDGPKSKNDKNTIQTSFGKVDVKKKPIR